MQSHFVKMNLKTIFCITLVLLLGAGTALAQQQVNLSAGATTLTLPDGSSVPMWGYTCAGSTVIASSTATCAPLNAASAALGQWSPVIITVPTSASGGLQINLTNNLTIAGNPIPTSLTIVGQLTYANLTYALLSESWRRSQRSVAKTARGALAPGRRSAPATTMRASSTPNGGSRRVTLWTERAGIWSSTFANKQR